LDALLKKLPNIESLYLSDTLIDHQTVKLIVSQCPKLRLLSLVSVGNKCDCIEMNEEINECRHCVHKCLLLLRRLPHLKTLSIDREMSSRWEQYKSDPYDDLYFNCVPNGPHITSQTFCLFIDRLIVLELKNFYGVEELAQFCLNWIGKSVAKNEFSLALDSLNYIKVTTKLKAMNVSIPDYFHIKPIDE